MADALAWFLAKAAAIDGVSERPSQFADAYALWVGRREIAHVEGTDRVDLRLTKQVIRQRRDELREQACIRFRPGTSDWIEVVVTAPAEAELALALFAAAVDANR